MDLTEFNEIRPYNDEELPQIFEELIADPAFHFRQGARRCTGLVCFRHA